MAKVLEVEGIKVRYSRLQVLHGVTMAMEAGETVSVLGSNGAGKSTLLRAIMGAQRIHEGRILFMGEEIHTLPTQQIVRNGIVYVPEEKMLFGPLSVEDNLRLGAYVIDDEKVMEENLEAVYNLFPILRDRKEQAATTLSGGEQQMVAIGRGLMSNPRILMLDEPSLGLAPLMVDEVFDTVKRLKERGMTILLVEQNVREALEIADRGYVLQTGKIVAEGTSKELLESDLFRTAFLGI
ncbi:MAG: branched-chain amino acid ABC transporter ATP-binding protein [Deltaproteobacteria bacterium]|nr:MAG: branched-chain amino acid ABC transporter ATP-binding protein [Deltaproteobacteria bacterium]RLC07164.1 MAG: branched-chain amino acid ABC transporter ATP-binding protein [Deltaproteobacteria bacterium]